MTPLGHFGIRCCTLPRRPDPNRQIINCEKRRQPATFKPLKPLQTFCSQRPRRAVLEPITTMPRREISEPIMIVAHNIWKGRSSTDLLETPRFVSKPHTNNGPAGDLKTDHDRSTQHMEMKVIYRSPRDPSGHSKTSHSNGSVGRSRN